MRDRREKKTRPNGSNAAAQMLRLECYSSNCKLAEVGKAHSDAQSATSTTSAIAEVALRFNFLF